MAKPKKRLGAKAPGSVRVVVRCRPLLAHERGTSSERILLDAHTVTVNDTVGEARQFTFDTVLPPEANQADTFAEVAPLVDHVLDGFHATVFAYGQTGSGKTYTMEGFQYKPVSSAHADGSTITGSAPDPAATPVDQHGIMLRMIQLLFDRARERQGTPSDAGGAAEEGNGDAVNDLGGKAQDGVQYSFRCSYYQIYNEHITDLLRGTSSGRRHSIAATRQDRSRASLGERGVDDELRIRWHSGDVFKVENLFLYECDSAAKMREALVSGVRHKVMGSHLMNAQSSRSHCVFTVYVERRNAATQQLQSRSELSLVDLAGSEKLKQLASDPSAELVRESIEINASLLALGKVIMALSSRPSGKRAGDGHVPYRDSKLTKLLKHALGGNSVTVMFACITPSDRYLEESVSTLLYAGRAKNIENVPRVNEDPTTVLIRQLREEIEQLRKEVAYYRALATDTLVQRESAVRSGVEPSAPGESGAAVGQGGKDSGSPATKADQLADSLLAACDMLRKVMGINGQLRDAFEVATQDRQAATQREVQLNAENLALRERIDMLESIALNPGLYRIDQSGTPVPGGGEGTRGRDAGPVGTHTSSASDDDDDSDDGSTRNSSPPRARRLSPAPPAAPKREPRSSTSGGRRVGDSRAGRKTRVATDSAVAPWEVSPAPPPPPPQQEWAAATAPAVMRAAPWDISTEERGSPSLQKPTRGTVRAPTPVFDDDDVQDTAPPPPVPTATTKKASKSKKKTKLKKVLVQRLKQYEKRYREPSHVETYADYYGKARAKVPENQQHTATLREMQETLKKLPRDMALTVVPLSLRQAGAFGTLAFGGSQADTQAFEDKRQQRASRREELLQKQKELRSTLRQDIAHVQALEHDGLLQSKGKDALSMYSTPDNVGTGKVKTTASKRSVTIPNLPPAPLASSVSSVDRLRAYLDKDRQSQPHAPLSLESVGASLHGIASPLDSNHQPHSSR